MSSTRAANLHAPVFAIVTPFTSDGALDEPALRTYLDWLASNGAQRIVTCGTTGEFPSLTLAERRRVLEISRSAFAGEIIANISTSSIGESRDLLAHARDHADAVLLLPPFYYADVPKQGIRDYFTAVAADSPLPVFLYNFPRHTQINLTPTMVSELAAQLPTLRGLKDSGGKWEQSLDYKRTTPSLEIIIGSDTAVLKALDAGLDGSVTGGGNAVPRVITSIEEHWRAGDNDAAQEAQARLTRWTEARKAAGAHEIAVVKATLARLLPGFSPTVRPPILPCSAEAATSLATLAKELAGL